MLVASYRFGAVLLACGLAVHAGIAAAQNYPAKPVRIVVPFGTGGSTDAVFRILGPRLAEGLGQQVVIDNRPGAAGSIGIGFVAKSPADGYTLGVATLAYVANPFVLSKLPYNTEKDLVPVSLITLVPLVLTVHPSIPARSVKAFIALAKSKPGLLNYASAGNASANSLAAEQFKYLAGINVTHVPYMPEPPIVISTSETKRRVHAYGDSMSCAVAVCIFMGRGGIYRVPRICANEVAQCAGALSPRVCPPPSRPFPRSPALF